MLVVVNFFSKIWTRLVVHSERVGVEVTHLKADDISGLSTGGTKGAVEQIGFVTKGFAGTNASVLSELKIERNAMELEALEASLEKSPSDSWVDHSDQLVRNKTANARSSLRIVVTKVYDHKVRCETGDWYFRREYNLSQSMFDAIFRTLASEFPTNDSWRIAEAIMVFEGIHANDIDCDPMYSGPVARMELPIKSVLLKPLHDEYTGSCAIRICER